jgi:hypothetical protein
MTVDTWSESVKKILVFPRSPEKWGERERWLWIAK